MYGGVEASQVRRIKELEEENCKLRRLLGEQALVIDMLKECSNKRLGIAERREVVRILVDPGCTV